MKFIRGMSFVAVAGGYAQAKDTAHFSYVQSAIGSGLNEPYGVAVDASSNVYIADTVNDRVLKETLHSDGWRPDGSGRSAKMRKAGFRK